MVRLTGLYSTVPPCRNHDPGLKSAQLQTSMMRLPNDCPTYLHMERLGKSRVYTR